MANLDSLYQKLPVSLQNMACSWQGWHIQRRRYNKRFHIILGQYRERANMTEAELQEYRDKKIRKFVHHAASTVPYYRDKFAAWKIDPRDVRTLEDLRHLPILTKDEVQQNLVKLHSEAIPGRDTIMTHTSGTTGRGLRFFMTLQAEHEQWAVWWRYRLEHDIGFDTPCAVFSGRSIVPAKQAHPPFWRYNKPANQILFSGYHLRMENMAAYIEEIRRSGVNWLHGYPSHLTLIASYLLDSHENLRDQITHVTTGAESLLAHQRQKMENAFGSRVRQHYGLAEGVANISECKHGKLHVDEDYSAVEFVRRDDARGYAIVGTNFTNEAFPLLRYDTGDIAYEISAGSNCPCRRSGRVVSSIEGRVEDYIVLKDGTKIGRMDHIFKDLTMIREAQIYQRQPGRIQLRIVRRPEFTERDEKKLRSEFEKYLGTSLHLEVRFLDSIERSSTGKLRFVISEIDSAGIHN